MNRNIQKDLPEWFKFPQPIKNHQRSLFQIDLEDALVALKISHDDLSRWKSKGWVSFDISAEFKMDEYDDPRIVELRFLRDIVRSGLSDAQMDYILSLLPKPLAFSPDRIAFSFQYGWVEAVRRASPEEVIEEHLDSWLDELDTVRLQDLQERIAELLEHSKED